MNNFAISSSTLLIGLIGLCVLILGVIFVMRNLLSKRAETDWSDKREMDSNVIGRNKYTAVNAFKWSNTFFMLSLTIALSVVLMAFNWTQFEERVVIPDGALIYEEDLLQTPPPPTTTPPPPPPPPPPVIEEVPEEDLEEEEEIEFVDLLVEEETEIAPPPKPVVKAAPSPPPPAPVIEETVEDIFLVVEEMPRFLGCEETGTKNEVKVCADQRLVEFLYKNLKYPAIARENGIEGTCVIQFTVEADGTVSDAQLVRDIGAGCGEEALRVVEMMKQGAPKWRPGMQRGEAVRVRFTLPVKFRLQ